MGRVKLLLLSKLALVTNNSILLAVMVQHLCCLLSRLARIRKKMIIFILRLNIWRRIHWNVLVYHIRLHVYHILHVFWLLFTEVSQLHVYIVKDACRGVDYNSMQHAISALQHRQKRLAFYSLWYQDACQQTIEEMLTSASGQYNSVLQVTMVLDASKYRQYSCHQILK